MKRDMDLIRLILITMEDSARPIDANAFTDQSHDFATVAYHFDLMQQAGLIHASIHGSSGRDYVLATADQITWQGHEFLSAVRGDSVWSEVKREVAKKAVDVPFAIIAQLATAMVMAQFGL